MACSAPNPETGMAIGLAEQFDCISETLGREGFLAVAGYTTSSGMLTSLLIISVALIGYHFIFFSRLDLEFGVSWAAKLGVILALLSGWTVFQTLFYDVMIAGPASLADLLLVSFGQTLEGTRETIQRSYDALRLGTLMSPEAFRATLERAGAAQENQQLPTAMPDAASSLLVATIGVEGALKIAVGFLLAIAPLPIAALLFSYSQGLFWGWLRALFAGFLAITVILLLNSLHISTLAASIARVYDQRLVTSSVMDDVQAIPAITTIFSLTALATLVGVLKVSGNLVAMTKSVAIERLSLGRRDHGGNESVPGRQPTSERSTIESAANPGTREDGGTASLVDSLNTAVRRESTSSFALAGGSANAPSRNDPEYATHVSRAPNRRRVLGRQHSSLKQRDKIR